MLALAKLVDIEKSIFKYKNWYISHSYEARHLKLVKKIVLIITYLLIFVWMLLLSSKNFHNIFLLKKMEFLALFTLRK